MTWTACSTGVSSGWAAERGVPVLWPGASAVSARPLRVLAFVEARGITGALRNLLDFAVCSARATPSIGFELATYRRSSGSDRDGPPEDHIQECIDAARRSGLHTHVLHERYAGDHKLLPQIRALLRTSCPDIVETHHVKSHFLVAASGARGKARWVAFHHGYTRTSLRTRAWNVLDRWSLASPASIITPCAAFAEELATMGVERSRIAVIHSAVPAPDKGADGARLRRALDVGDSTPVVLAVGRLSREKAHSVLLEALVRPELEHVGAVIVIAGEGPERRPLMQLAKRLGIADRVHLVGHQPEIWPCYAAADAVALPSDSEGSPIALLEAMAAGKAVVATRVGGIPEILDDGVTGLLVPPRNPAGLASALASVLTERDLAARLGARALAAVQRRFSQDARTAALISLYQAVAAP